LDKNIDQLCVDTIRMLALDTVQKATSGHPGMPLGAAPMAYTLFGREMRYNPENPRWFNRDRFLLSAGHGSALLYALLHLFGFEQMTLQELKRFRQWESATPGHPEYEPDYGVETTTGPLGQGFATGIGVAIAEANLAARYNRRGYNIIDHYTYAIVSDGDLMEGVASEGASLAGHLKLGKLIYLYDDNKISLSGETLIAFTEDVRKRFESYGWQVIQVEDGNDLAALYAAVEEAKGDTHHPSLVMVSTHIGYGTPVQDTFEAHGNPLKAEQLAETKKFYGWPPDQPFHIPEEALSHFRKRVKEGKKAENAWQELFQEYSNAHPSEARELSGMMEGSLPEGWDEGLPVFDPDPKGVATRKAGGQVLNALAGNIPSLVGGSADLDPSTNTALKGMGSFQPEGQCPAECQGLVDGPLDYRGRNIAFGVREHTMAAIMNGVALHGGLIPFGATFFVFSDYLKPSLRIGCISRCHNVYVFTHDSVGVGEDGPTHQPVEHLAALRAVPRLTVIRPADANETREAWKLALLRRGGPTALVLSRQNVPIFDRTQYSGAEGISRGGYVMAEASEGEAELIILATGSEVHLALEAHRLLNDEGIRVRVVNLASWEIFEEQDEEYKNMVLPPTLTRRVSIEAGATLGWHKYVGVSGEAIGIDRFGASAPGGEALANLGISVDNLVSRAKAVLLR